LTHAVTVGTVAAGNRPRTRASRAASGFRGTGAEQTAQAFLGNPQAAASVGKPSRLSSFLDSDHTRRQVKGGAKMDSIESRRIFSRAISRHGLRAWGAPISPGKRGTGNCNTHLRDDVAARRARLHRRRGASSHQDLGGAAKGIVKLRDLNGDGRPTRIPMARATPLLVVAHSDLAMLAVTRNAARQRDFTLRIALGAGRLFLCFRPLPDSTDCSSGFARSRLSQRFGAA
jgi:hypothetical protein